MSAQCLRAVTCEKTDSVRAMSAVVTEHARAGSLPANLKNP